VKSIYVHVSLNILHHYFLLSFHTGDFTSTSLFHKGLTYYLFFHACLIKLKLIRLSYGNEDVEKYINKINLKSISSFHLFCFVHVPNFQLCLSVRVLEGSQLTGGWQMQSQVSRSTKKKSLVITSQKIILGVMKEHPKDNAVFVHNQHGVMRNFCLTNLNLLL